MAKKSSVGKSDLRTPGKHDALDKFLGRQAGVCSMYKDFKTKTFHIIDCTAGDGEASEYSGKTSPFIIEKHCKYMKDRNIDARPMLIEKSPKTFEKLKQNSTLPSFLGDAKNLKITWRQDDLLFVINDPNHIGHWSLPEALRHAPRLTTVFSTLGCNVGGIKRVPIEERILWKENIYKQLDLLQNWHDALLVRLEKDDAQWAYLVNAPKKWKKELLEDFERAFKKWEKGLAMTWYKEDRKKFDQEIFILMATQKEKDGGEYEIFNA